MSELDVLENDLLEKKALETDLSVTESLEDEMDTLDLLGDDLDLDLELKLDTNLNSTQDALADIKKNTTTQGNSNFDLIKDIPVEITVEVSRKTLPLKELMNFESGNIIMLDKKEGEPVDIKINGVLFGTGNIIAQDGKYGVRILSMVKHDKAL